MSNKYHYVTAEPLGLTSIHCKIQYFTSAVLQDACMQFSLHVTCSLRERRVGECAVGSKEPLRIMGIRAVWTVAPSCWNPTGTLRWHRH